MEKQINQPRRAIGPRLGSVCNQLPGKDVTVFHEIESEVSTTGLALAKLGCRV